MKNDVFSINWTSNEFKLYYKCIHRIICIYINIYHDLYVEINILYFLENRFLPSTVPCLWSVPRCWQCLLAKLLKNTSSKPKKVENDS